MVRLRLLVALITTATVAAVAPSALADAVSSSNWAGYAVHRPGVSFTKVLGTWTQPTAACVSGRQSYSALWVGLGGYDASSQALEQIGTEVDCTAFGRVSSTAWYELVPAPSRSIRMNVRPGDRMFASVVVSGNRTVLTLQDLTTRQTFRRTFNPANVDVSSAEWIVEAPSECVSNNSCQTLPLADFGSASFGLAKAQAVGGHTGAIADPSWDWTQIKLTPGGTRFVSMSGSRAGAAIPSALNARGNGFSVTFSTMVARAMQHVTAAVMRDGYIVHPGR